MTDKDCEDELHYLKISNKYIVESQLSRLHLSGFLVKVALNRLSPAAQNNLFQPTRLISYFRVAQNFVSVQLNLRVVIACDTLV